MFQPITLLCIRYYVKYNQFCKWKKKHFLKNGILCHQQLLTGRDMVVMILGVMPSYTVEHPWLHHTQYHGNHVMSCEKLFKQCYRLKHLDEKYWWNSCVLCAVFTCVHWSAVSQCQWELQFPSWTFIFTPLLTHLNTSGNATDSKSNIQVVSYFR